METVPFSAAEKRLAARLLHQVPGGGFGVTVWGVYLVPSLLFCAYGFWTRDFAAVLVAYAALFLVVALYLNYAREQAKVLHSLLTKYETRVGALRELQDSSAN